MKNYWIYAALAVIFLPAGLFAMGGSGSQADPWVIENETDLETIMTDDSYWDDYIEIELTGGTYLDMNGKTCSPIGTSSDEFTGHFDGKNVEIRNVEIDNSYSDYQGFFGYIKTPVSVQNVILKDVSITGDEYVGGLCGLNEGGSISSCRTSGEVNGVGNSGGICGQNYDNGTIDNCSSSCEVINDENNAGGLCGRNNYSEIKNSFSTGNVECGKNNHDNSYAGGFCGYNYNGTITGCFSTGSVVAEGNSVGGFCGFNFRPNSIIENCYSTGDAEGIDKVGGFVGENAYQSSVNNCYSTGNAEGEDYVGGFCGVNGYSDIEYCYSTGIPTATGSYEGGFIGNNGGTCTCDFWNTSTSGKSNAVGNDDSDGITGLNNAQFADQSYFESCFDFENVWMMGGKLTNYGYSFPMLRVFYLDIIPLFDTGYFIALSIIIAVLGIFFVRKIIS